MRTRQQAAGSADWNTRSLKACPMCRISVCTQRHVSPFINRCGPQHGGTEHIALRGRWTHCRYRSLLLPTLPRYLAKCLYTVRGAVDINPSNTGDGTQLCHIQRDPCLSGLLIGTRMRVACHPPSNLAQPCNQLPCTRSARHHSQAGLAR